MAATDKHYRNQHVLNIIFSVSCALLLLSTFWMLAEDFNRPYKSVQRKFRDVEAALNQRMMLAELPNREAFAEHQAALEEARESLAQARAEVQDVQRRLNAEMEQLDTEYRGIKANYDAQASYVNIAVEHWGEATDPEIRERLKQDVDQQQAKLAALEQDLIAAEKKLNIKKQEIEEKVTRQLRGPNETVAQAEREFKRIMGAFDRFAKTASQKTWKFGDTFRALPILDAFASPTKIHQYSLPDLTIDYGGFEDVPRYDRCSSCHLGIERGTFDRASLEALRHEPDYAWADLEEVKKILKEREGERLGFDPKSLPSQDSWMPTIVGLVAFLVVAGLGAFVGYHQNSWGTGLGVGTMGLVVGFLAWGFAAYALPAPQTIQTIDLTEGEVTQYAAHPRLDLFVDGNSPHSAQKFGCTICHQGQGSATDFFNAAHTPSNAEEREEWDKKYHWHRSHYWDFPMFSSRFVESSCLQCHHEVTDLIRFGSREEAPKLLKGYRLVLDNGCYGCHEIAGTKKDRRVGPDLRLEPAPALEYLTPAEREKMTADKSNPPGTLRKSGPSLRRLAEKTDSQWTAAWLKSPRGFRHDTKMPHFYGLSTNSSEAIEKEAKSIKDEKLRKKLLVQKDFPHTEIHSVAHYLIEESKGHLGFPLPKEKGDSAPSDTYRKTLREEIGKLNKQLKKRALTNREWKQLEKVSRQLGYLALMSVPSRKASINTARERLKNLQGEIQRLHEIQGKIERDHLDLGTQLDNLTSDLVQYSKPTPVSQAIFDAQGNEVQVPPVPGDNDIDDHLDAGRRLFTEKGCLACHGHKRSKSVKSYANFGPDLSRVAAKLRPAINTKDGARRWLIQWILNPNLHHPRTKMPITHLSTQEAAQVADWLLSVEVTDWNEKEQEPKTPSMDELQALARVYLIKAPGFSRLIADEYLPDPSEGKEPKGIPQEAFQRMGLAVDADERRLTKMTEDNLKWYIGRKAISRMGCFGCHDIPGFEGAKPIGTGLNDWGKKDPARIAFEDGATFAHKRYHIVPVRRNEGRLIELQRQQQDYKDGVPGVTELTKQEKAELRKLKQEPAFRSEDGKAPYEEFYLHALEHHEREGFLHQKLMAPRSYDYHRFRAWDDRLRMPQFKFARSRPRYWRARRQWEGDDPLSKKEFEAREQFEEAEAREAVMTFVLGLLAEPIPLQYVHQPDRDRLAEVQGRQVLEKYNCAGCHQVDSGVYQVNPSADVLEKLEERYQGLPTNVDHIFMNHNAWIGQPSPIPGQLLLHGTQPQTEPNPDDPSGPPGFSVRLTRALRFTDTEGQERNIPAGTKATVPMEAVTSSHKPFGGTLTRLLVGYIDKTEELKLKAGNEAGAAYSLLPPPLLREGERVQTKWLYQFLLNPEPVRPTTRLLLRMPKFNLSEAEARKLVNYFASRSRRSNPGAGVTYPYLSIPQRDQQYWRDKSAPYVDRLKQAKGKDAKVNELAERLKSLKPAWDAYLKDRLSQAEELQKQADAVLKEANKTLENARKKVDQAQKDVEAAMKAKDPEKTAKAEADLQAARQALNVAQKARQVAEERKQALDARVKALKGQIQAVADNKDSEVREKWLARRAYATDAFRLLHNKTICVTCHSIGTLKNPDPKGPNLALAQDRLRPEWTYQWIANPERMFAYSPTMPQNFPKNRVQFQKDFLGSSREQTRAVRDILMDFRRVAELPGNHFRLQVPAEGGNK